jgi:hypothetical protein
VNPIKQKTLIASMAAGMNPERLALFFSLKKAAGLNAKSCDHQ